MNLEKSLIEEKKKLDIRIDKISREIERLSKIVGTDRLACNESRGVPQYFINGKYASKRKSMNKIKALAQFEYDQKVLDVLQKKSDAVEKLMSFGNDDAFENVYNEMCSSRRKAVVPVLEARDDFVERWAEEKYEPYDRWDDVKSEFYTVKGERVRSKAEKMIADELAHYGIPYRYEYPIELMDGRERKTVRPDFIALNCRSREEYIIEHLGMMNKLSYYNHNLDKLDVYERNGYMIGINLIVFHETSDNPLSIMVVRRYLEEFLL